MPTFLSLRFHFGLVILGSSMLLGQSNLVKAHAFASPRDPFLQQQKLTPSDGAAGEYFGDSVALSSDGNTALVGANYKTVGSNQGQGAAYVFVRSGGTWSRQQELTASDGASEDWFGASVALSGDGNTALVGAPGAVDWNRTGAAYVFTRSGGSWTQQQELTPSDSAASDYFGFSVALSGNGNTALVGAFNENIGSNLFQGSAYVFTSVGGNWTQQQELAASDAAAGDYFGYSVALSSDGSTALVGAQYHAVKSNILQGAAYVFTNSGGSWNQQAELTASDGVAYGVFGTAVALSSNGNTALVGAAPLSNLDTGPVYGAAYVFTQANGSWSQQAELSDPDKMPAQGSDGFGMALTLSGDGNTALVGAPEGGGPLGAAAYVFTNSGGSWSQQQRLGAFDVVPGNNYFGQSVALSSDGNTVLVGAPGQGPQSPLAPIGAAYVFQGNELQPFVTITGFPRQPLTKDNNGDFVALVTITNAGNITLDSVQVTIAGTALGSAPLLAAPPAVTNLAPGAKATFTLTFPGTPELSAATTAPLEVSGTYSVPSASLSGDWTLNYCCVNLVLGVLPPVPLPWQPR